MVKNILITLAIAWAGGAFVMWDPFWPLLLGSFEPQDRTGTLGLTLVALFLVSMFRDALR